MNKSIAVVESCDIYSRVLVTCLPAIIGHNGLGTPFGKQTYSQGVFDTMNEHTACLLSLTLRMCRRCKQTEPTTELVSLATCAHARVDVICEYVSTSRHFIQILSKHFLHVSIHMTSRPDQRRCRRDCTRKAVRFTPNNYLRTSVGFMLSALPGLLLRALPRVTPASLSPVVQRAARLVNGVRQIWTFNMAACITCVRTSVFIEEGIQSVEGFAVCHINQE